MKKEEILTEIKKRVLLQEPGAEIILYGSYARGDNQPDSDIDLLILLEKENISRDDEKKITHPLFFLELETNQVISPLIRSKKSWNELYPNTALFRNIQKDGIAI